MKTYKWRKIDYLRLAVQLMFFILAPGIFSAAFAGVKRLAVQAGTQGLGEVSFSASLKLCLILLIFTVLFGRFFCGWACAFGAYNDWINAIARNLGVKQSKKLLVSPKVKYLKFVVLAIILAICATGFQSFMSGKSPWDVFAKFAVLRFSISGYTIGFVMFLLVTLSAIFSERFFCRALCPMGALFAIVGKIPSPFSIAKKEAKCGKCTICSSSCPGNIQITGIEKVSTGECFACGRCVNVCPRKNMNVKIFGKVVNQYATLAVQTLLLVALLYWLQMI